MLNLDFYDGPSRNVANTLFSMTHKLSVWIRTRCFTLDRSLFHALHQLRHATLHFHAAIRFLAIDGVNKVSVAPYFGEW